jgi:glycosyltransferase involved in cell wall biosynthesis
MSLSHPLIIGSQTHPLVSVVIPARNEAENIGICLESLSRQEGIAFEIYVVDDHSIDQTREIAQGYARATVLPAVELTRGWRGKANAICTAIPYLKGEWLLFTDADTVHLPGSLAASVQEASECGADLLSYSPLQEAGTMVEKCVQPIVFGQLARAFNYAEVNDPAHPLAAANGQFMLFRKDSYVRIGGHEAVKGSLLEDVELARLIKKNGRLCFRYAPDRVHTRMYRGFSQMEEGWTKNLALLFPNVFSLALRTLGELVAILGGAMAGLMLLRVAHPWVGLTSFAIALAAFLNFAIRLRRAGFSAGTAIPGLVGLPIFVYLLVRSYYALHFAHEVSWRGRTYKNP